MRYAQLVERLAAEIPGFRVVRKDHSRLHRAIDRALAVVTLGKMRDYLTSYHTTIGRTVYVTADWDALSDDDRYVTLRHEAIHLRQFRRFTTVGMSYLYLCVPLPMGFAWFRAYFEAEAYAESIRAAAEVWGRDYPKDPTYRARIVDQFVGPSYAWMWPFRQHIERWYDQVLASLDTNR